MKLTSTSRVQLPTVAPNPAKRTPAPAAPATGWGAKTSQSERKVLQGAIDDAVALKPGASFNARLAHVKHLAATFGADSAKVISERLGAKLPAQSAEERGRLLRTATALGVATPEFNARLLQDAVNAGDAPLALELVTDGATLRKDQRAQLAPFIRGDEVLQSADATTSLTRAALSVLAEEPAQLKALARSISSPASLFAEVIANKDKALADHLKPLVKLLTPKEAAGFASRSAALPTLRTALEARAAAR